MAALLLRTIPTKCIEYGKDKHGGYSTTFWTLMWEGTLQGTENKCRNQTSQKIFGLQSFLPEKICYGKGGLELVRVENQDLILFKTHSKRRNP